MITVGMWTGPLPPAKPCAECGPLRKEVQELLKRLAIAEAKPTVFSISTATDEVEKVDAASGHTVHFCTTATETQKSETIDSGSDAQRIDTNTTECQTSPVATMMAEVGVDAEPPIMVDALLQTDEQARAHFGVNTDEVQETKVETSEQATVTDEFEKAASVDRETMTTRTYYRNIPVQTDAPEVEEAQEVRVIILNVLDNNMNLKCLKDVRFCQPCLDMRHT
ncbi:unnamed protein product [Cylicostephanus goldi]|uniref:Uncharacterized protein n=1 Tax=Cylicostephanus goldi TaxID=71465 RepID=A0A3P7PYG2_CYLGO|nr:unnamed protein product [Cylicostephanus goldi]